MPFAKAGGVRLFYRLDGNTDKPVVVFVHSLGTDHSLWDRQAEDLLPYFRVLRCDVRGHGASESTPGDYSVAMLAGDVVALASALGIEKFALCGLSLGGMIGQWLGANRPERLTHLVLANTSAKFPAPEIMESRRQQALATGMRHSSIPPCSAAFCRNRSRRIPRSWPRCGAFFSLPIRWATPGAARRSAISIRSGCSEKIRVPTLVIGGDRDVSTPWEGHGDLLAARIPGAKQAVLPAAHSVESRAASLVLGGAARLPSGRIETTGRRSGAKYSAMSMSIALPRQRPISIAASRI